MNKLITICKYINDLLPNALIIAFALKVILAPTLDFAQSSVVISLITLFGYRHYLRHFANVNEQNLQAKIVSDKDIVDQRLDAHSDAIEELKDKYQKAEAHKIANTPTMPDGQFNVDQHFMNQFLPPER